MPTIHSGYWDPFFAACEETETVLCLHVGSSGTSPTTSADAPPEIPAVLFGAYGMYSAVDWLYSKIPVRFPDIKICLSEGGIGWVAGIIDRLDHCFKYQLGYLPTWRDVELTPSEVLRRNFWFCALDDDSNMALRHRIGLEHVLVESDYPHADSSWPDTQAMLVRQLRDQNIPDDEAERITWRNAPSCSVTNFPEARPSVEHDCGRRRPQRARAHPDGVAFVESATGESMTWSEYDTHSSLMAGNAREFALGDRGRAAAPRRARRARGDARVREGGHCRGRYRRSCR